jgi:anti-sigma B factor antagonist
MDRLRQERLPNGDAVVYAHGELDAADVDRLRVTIQDSFTTGAKVVVDLSGITYLDSSILAALITESLDADRANRRLVLAIGANGLLRNFELKGLMQVMHIVADAAEAADA